MSSHIKQSYNVLLCIASSCLFHASVFSISQQLESQLADERAKVRAAASHSVSQAAALQQLSLAAEGQKQHAATLQAAADALRARNEATALERDTAALSASSTAAELKALRREHGAALERNVALQTKMDATEAAVTRLRADAEVLANAAKSRAAQSARLLRERAALLRALAEAREFVAARGIAVGGARFRKELLEFLAAAEAGAGAAPAPQGAVSAVSEAVAASRARAQRREAGDASDAEGDDDDGLYEREPGSARGRSSSARGHSRGRQSAGADAAAAPLVTALEAAAATAAKAQAPVGGPAASGEPRARAWTAAAQIKAQQEYIAQLETTVGQCREKIRTLTHRFRTAAGEREKVRSTFRLEHDIWVCFLRFIFIDMTCALFLF